MTLPKDPKIAAVEITQLRKAGKLSDALALGEASLEASPDNWSIKNALAWVVYEKFVKTRKGGGISPEEAGEVLARLRVLKSHQLYGNPSPYVMSVLKLSENLSVDGFHQDAVGELGQLDVRQLSTEGSSYEGFAVPSQALKYYTLLSKSLVKLNKMAEVVKICDEALASDAVTLSQEKMWFYYRRAQALQDEHPREALGDIDRFLAINEAWYAVNMKAKILANLGNRDGSRKEYGRAVTLLRPAEYDKAISLLADYALVVDQKEITEGLIQSVRAIRNENGWKADSTIERIARELDLGMASGFSYRPFIAGLRSSRAESPVGLSSSRSAADKLVLAPAMGKLRRILPGNTHGFMTVEGFGDTYFRGSDNPDIGWPPQDGQVYVGKIVEAYDKRKNAQSTKFVDGRPEPAQTP